MTIQTTIERITPAIAEAYLEMNTRNRTMRDNHVYKLASDIEAGRWHINGASIVFNGDGTLLDGQHRLAAIVKAGKPVEMLVVRGVSKAAMATIDANISRKASDAAQLAGYTNTNNLVGTVRLLMNVKLNTVARGDWASTGTIMEFLRVHPHIQDSVNAANKMAKIVPVTLVGAWHYLAFYVGGFEKDATAAMNVLETGIPHYPEDAIHAFRERSLRDKKSLQGGISQRMRALYTLIHAWNDFVDREPRMICRIQQNTIKMIGVDYSTL